MNYRNTTFYLLLSVAATIPAACSDETKKKLTLQYAVESMFGVDSEAPEVTAAKAFDETDPDIRRMAIEKLSHKRWALRDPYLKRFSMLAQEQYESDPSVRAVAVRTLGAAGNSKYKPQVIAALNDSEAVVRWDAATVLSRWPDEKAVLTLQRLAIQDPSVDVRATAATALRHYRTDSVYRTLLRALDDKDFTVRDAAHESLVFQTGIDRGYDPLSWAGDELGRETLPEPNVRYRKRPWWDWMKITEETEKITPESEKKDKRPWWDWFGTTENS